MRRWIIEVLDTNELRPIGRKEEFWYWSATEWVDWARRDNRGREGGSKKPKEFYGKRKIRQGKLKVKFVKLIRWNCNQTILKSPGTIIFIYLSLGTGKFFLLILVFQNKVWVQSTCNTSKLSICFSLKTNAPLILFKSPSICFKWTEISFHLNHLFVH